ncbi:MAG: hypothetical protein M1379_15365 [Firmicutes bacterium]|nr:hypothetical protein [Bacillota bacterium]
MNDFLVALLIYTVGVAVFMIIKKGKGWPPILRQPYERRSTDTGPRSAPVPAGTARNEPEEDSEGTTLEGDFRTDWREDASDPEGVSLEGRDQPEINKAEKGDKPQNDREFQPFDSREFGTTSPGDVQGEWTEEELAWDQAIREDARREILRDGEASASPEAVGAAGVAGGCCATGSRGRAGAWAGAVTCRSGGKRGRQGFVAHRQPGYHPGVHLCGDPAPSARASPGQAINTGISQTMSASGFHRLFPVM